MEEIIRLMGDAGLHDGSSAQVDRVRSYFNHVSDKNNVSQDKFLKIIAKAAFDKKLAKSAGGHIQQGQHHPPPPEHAPAPSTSPPPAAASQPQQPSAFLSTAKELFAIAGPAVKYIISDLIKNGGEKTVKRSEDGSGGSSSRTGTETESSPNITESPSTATATGEESN